MTTNPKTTDAAVEAFIVATNDSGKPLPDDALALVRRGLLAALPHMQQAGVALDYVPGNLDHTAPERIWLQINAHDGDNDDRDETFPRNEGNVTWCASSCGGLEIQYVRADLATTPAQPEAGDLLRQAHAVLTRFRTQDDDAITVCNRIDKLLGG